MLHLKKTYESKINNFISLDMVSRSKLVNLTDEDTTKNNKSFGYMMEPNDEPVRYDEPVPMNGWVVDRLMEEFNPMTGGNERLLGRIRNIRAELENLPNMVGDTEGPDNEVDLSDWMPDNEYPDHRA